MNHQLKQITLSTIALTTLISCKSKNIEVIQINNHKYRITGILNQSIGGGQGLIIESRNTKDFSYNTIFKKETSDLNPIFYKIDKDKLVFLTNNKIMKQTQHFDSNIIIINNIKPCDTNKTKVTHIYFNKFFE